MSHFSLNGLDFRVPLDEETSFHDALEYLRKNLITDQTLISSIRVNGNEMNSSDEHLFSQIPLSQISSIEVFTAHPKEVVEDTLQHLIEFAEILESTSSKAGELVGEVGFAEKFTNLIDGINTVIEAISHVKKILNLTQFPVIDRLEFELLSILNRLLTSQKAQDASQTRILLTEDLPKNLKQWREEGLPKLKTSRDS